MGPSNDSNQPAINTLRVDEASFIEADCSTQPVVNIFFVDDRDSCVVEIHTEILVCLLRTNLSLTLRMNPFIYLQTMKSFDSFTQDLCDAIGMSH